MNTPTKRWIINTVGCVNKTAEKMASMAQMQYGSICDGVYTFAHPHGCSQLGEDNRNTQTILKGLVKHPNAGAELVIGLGFEDEIEAALEIIGELADIISLDIREERPASDLIIGLKCGGSDGLSGITANPLLGTVYNKIIDSGGSSILTEVPEMFGAETVLMNRARDKSVFKDTVDLINDFKLYFQRHNQVVYENPSPGNKEGGITTLEDKSLGCIRKGGQRKVTAVLDYGQPVESKGLNLLNGPGNDIVAVTNLAAAGAHMTLFTTGRGTPLGGPVPTVKISSNSELAAKKKNWIDFDAGVLTTEMDMNALSEDFLKYIFNVASGKKVLNEINGYREIAIFKDGVTL